MPPPTLPPAPAPCAPGPSATAQALCLALDQLAAGLVRARPPRPGDPITALDPDPVLAALAPEERRRLAEALRRLITIVQEDASA